MKKNNLPICSFFMTIVIALGHLVYFYPKLPPRMASHFSASGRPDSWTEKGDLLIIYFVTFLPTALIFLGIKYLIHKTPVSIISLPNKEIWLSPEHKEKSYDYISNWGLWFGIVTMILLVLVVDLVFRANLTPGPELSTMVWLYLILYMVYTIVAIIFMVRRFMKKPK